MERRLEQRKATALLYTSVTLVSLDGATLIPRSKRGSVGSKQFETGGIAVGPRAGSYVMATAGPRLRLRAEAFSTPTVPQYLRDQELIAATGALTAVLRSAVTQVPNGYIRLVVLR